MPWFLFERRHQPRSGEESFAATRLKRFCAPIHFLQPWLSSYAANAAKGILRGDMNPIRLFIFVLVAAAALPAFAQVDFSGEWAPLYHEDSPERLPGPELGDYLELPINDAARMRADSWEADRISVVLEYQCRPHASDYGLRGLGNIRIWKDLDPATQRLISFKMHFLAYDSERTIWMDGRPH